MIKLEILKVLLTIAIGSSVIKASNSSLLPCKKDDLNTFVEIVKRNAIKELEMVLKHCDYKKAMDEPLEIAGTETHDTHAHPEQELIVEVKEKEKKTFKQIVLECAVENDSYEAIKLIRQIAKSPDDLKELPKKAIETGRLSAYAGLCQNFLENCKLTDPIKVKNPDYDSKKDPDDKKIIETTVIHLMIVHGSHHKLVELIKDSKDKKDEYLMAKDGQGKTPLYYAVQHCETELIKPLFTEDAAKWPIVGDNHTIISLALESCPNNKEVAEELLEFGLEPTETDEEVAFDNKMKIDVDRKKVEKINIIKWMFQKLFRKSKSKDAEGSLQEQQLEEQQEIGDEATGEHKAEYPPGHVKGKELTLFQKLEVKLGELGKLVKKKFAAKRPEESRPTHDNQLHLSVEDILNSFKSQAYEVPEKDGLVKELIKQFFDNLEDDYAQLTKKATSKYEDELKERHAALEKQERAHLDAAQTLETRDEIHKLQTINEAHGLSSEKKLVHDFLDDLDNKSNKLAEGIASEHESESKDPSSESKQQ